MIDVSVNTCCKLKLVFYIFFIMVRLLVLSDKDQKTVGTLSYFFIMIPARKYGNSLERKRGFPFQ